MLIIKAMYMFLGFFIPFKYSFCDVKFSERAKSTDIIPLISAKLYKSKYFFQLSVDENRGVTGGII